MTTITARTPTADHPIGSEFAWQGVSSGPRSGWPTPHLLFSCGRGALLSAWRHLDRPRLWIPDYFCPPVASAWSAAGVGIVFYCDDPQRSAPDWTSLSPPAGDAVLAVNYFGVRAGDVWRNWRRSHPTQILIEDHTHDPLSRWALESQSDFAFASLRKTLPAPDGAILWSPRGRSLPPAPAAGDWSGSALKLAGMVFKREYVAWDHCPERFFGRDNGPILHRRFEIEGEQRLESAAGAISPWSEALLAAGYPLDWRERRERNVRSFIDLWKTTSWRKSHAELLFDDWPVGHCPFNPVLVFENAESRDICRQRLIEAKIYPPVHWPILLDDSPSRHSQRKVHDSESRATVLSRRILTIPLDFRCDEMDIERIVRTLFDVQRSQRIHGGRHVSQP